MINPSNEKDYPSFEGMMEERKRMRAIEQRSRDLERNATFTYGLIVGMLVSALLLVAGALLM